MKFLFLIPLSLFLSSCSVPDLTEPAVMADAKSSAIELHTLERKFMYGMFYLFVEDEDDPFTGWVKTSGLKGQLMEIGYLKDGRREGRWMKWDGNGAKLSEIGWHEDRLEGAYQTWYTNGQVKEEGQTRDGEMDGEWKEYYPNGQLRSQMLCQIGIMVNIRVWQPDGTQCNHSRVMDGNGSYYRYRPDGSREHFRSFINGKETKKEQY